MADCVPVALVGEKEVTMIHSGWRGTLSGIAGKAVRTSKDDGVRAYIGPCIRRCCYEVSEELAGQFAERFGPKSSPDATYRCRMRSGQTSGSKASIRYTTWVCVPGAGRTSSTPTANKAPLPDEICPAVVKVS